MDTKIALYPSRGYRTEARQAINNHQLTVRLACQAFKISETCYRYDPKLSSENELIADWLLRITATHKQWGFGLCFMYLRNTKGFKWNHKRVYRIYKQLELNLRIKPRRRIKRDKPQALSVPLSINQTWSIDFMSDSLNTGRKIRTFNVIDDYNRECLGIEVDHSLPAQRVIQSLERLIEWRGKPKAIRCDNGPEYISHALREWAQAMGIELMYIQPGKPTQNAYIERFNRTARNEWLNMHIFDSIEHAQSLATQWMWVYNNERPHSSIGGIPPRKLLEAI